MLLERRCLGALLWHEVVCLCHQNRVQLLKIHQVVLSVILLQSAQDSRTFGPLDMKNIVGRAIYSSHSSVDHGHVQNSDEAMRRDSAVLAVELDLDEITRQSS
ncbi:hypothetical protein O6H91_15G005400 [Diphasiastrum complanatum]|uniref:Uncharacterized protein n=1 Tax=Diphasiastrum complanatum TaxID=34168 RepID=A0ACC2BFE8_DIPCM|nr:hypothetical protein O6H91_15G005400 [Diphasiastrum complanatum]